MFVTLPGITYKKSPPIGSGKCLKITMVDFGYSIPILTNIPSSKIFHCFLLSVKFLKSSGENCWCSSLLWKYKCWSATDGRWKAFLLTIFAGFIVYVINFISLTLGKLFKSLSGTALYQKSLYIWQLHLTQVEWKEVLLYSDMNLKFALWRSVTGLQIDYRLLSLI